LWWRGRPVVVDPGTYTYERGPDRDWFRSTRARSTVTVDDRDQFRLWGAFRSGPLPNVSLRYARDGAVEASVVLHGRVRHVRRIEWSANDVFVVDQLEGKGRHRVASRLVWAPGPPAVEFALHGAGELTSEEGFLSERFGERQPISIGAIVAELTFPGSLGFRLRCLG
ncbi:MAG: heparinase II/III family protein, partial [Gaiellaceae bacterium]